MWESLCGIETASIGRRVLQFCSVHLNAPYCTCNRNTVVLHLYVGLQPRHLRPPPHTSDACYPTSFYCPHSRSDAFYLTNQICFSVDSGFKLSLQHKSQGSSKRKRNVFTLKGSRSFTKWGLTGKLQSRGSLRT